MSVTEYINREAPDIEARKLGLIDTAKALTEKAILFLIFNKLHLHQLNN